MSAPHTTNPRPAVITDTIVSTLLTMQKGSVGALMILQSHELTPEMVDVLKEVQKRAVQAVEMIADMLDG